MIPNAKTSLRILFILDNYYPYIGGAETLFKKLAEGLVSKGYQITVVTSQWKDALEQETLNGVQIFRVKSSRYLLPFKSKKIIQKQMPFFDVVLTSTYAMAPIARKISKKFNKPCVLVVHEILNDIWVRSMGILSGYLHRLAEYWITNFLKFESYVAVSNFTKNQLLDCKIDSSKISMIYNAFDPLPHAANEFKFTKRDNSFHLLFSGRPGASKGGLVLLKAIKQLREQGEKIHLTMILGLDPKGERNKYHKFVEKHLLKDFVEIVEPVPLDVLSAYANAVDACIVPSLQEGFGIMAAQFGLLDKLLIVSKKGALPESVGGKVVWIDEINPDEVASSIKKAIKNECKIVEKRDFSWEQLVHEYDLLLKKVSQVEL